jgi:hypothetical protein
VSSRGPLDFDEEPPGAAPPAPPPAAPPPPARRPGSRASWAVGVLLVALLVYITLNTLRTDTPGARGIPDDSPLPPFATPIALGPVRGDANVARAAGQGRAGKVPACSVRRPGVLNVCQLAERGPVVLTFLIDRGGVCTRQLDEIERVRARFPGVQFAAVAVRGSRGRLRELIREHGWRFPVGYDHDGAVANVYFVGVCPTVTFAYPGGIAMRTTVGLLKPPELERDLRRLVAGSERRGWRAPGA